MVVTMIQIHWNGNKNLLLSTVGVRSKWPLVMCRNSIASDLIYNYHSSSPLSCMELKFSKNKTSIIKLHNDVLKHALTPFKNFTLLVDIFMELPMC